MTFTQSNTDGYTQEELNLMNGAVKRVISGIGTIDEYQTRKTVEDMVNNAYFPGISENELVIAVYDRLGT